MEYKVGDLVRQRGLILCRIKCEDDTLSWDRDDIIREVLDDSEREMDVADIIKEVPDGDVEPDSI